MFIKFGQEEHLESLRTNGEMYFSPCSAFREIEETQVRGIGDKHDGGIHVPTDRIWIEGQEQLQKNTPFSMIVEPALNTPVFCLRKTESKSISPGYREKLREQFPNHTHALIIDDEKSFLENVRICFQSKAFAHKVFYQDYMAIEFAAFLCAGESDIDFDSSELKNGWTPGKLCFQSINGSSFHRTMFMKNTFFADQLEYRIVLPYERIKEGKKYYIAPFTAELCRIDDLVQN